MQIVYPNLGLKKSEVPKVSLFFPFYVVKIYYNFYLFLKHLILGPWSGENEFYYDPLYFSQYSYVPMTEAQLPPMPSARKRPRTDVTFINSRLIYFLFKKLIILIL